MVQVYAPASVVAKRVPLALSNLCRRTNRLPFSGSAWLYFYQNICSIPSVISNSFPTFKQYKNLPEHLSWEAMQHLAASGSYIVVSD